MNKFILLTILITILLGCSKSEETIKKEVFDTCLLQANQTFSTGNFGTKIRFMEQCMMAKDYFYKNDFSCPDKNGLDGAYEMYFIMDCYE